MPWWDIFFGADEIARSESKAKAPYKQVSLVYTCVNELIKGIQSLPLVLSTIDERIVESGPVYDLLFNGKQSWQHFVEQTIGHFALSHDVFWIFLDDQGNPDIGGVGSKTREIYVVSGTQMRAMTDTGSESGNLIGWEYFGRNGEHALFTPAEVWQWKGFDPYRKFHGLAPIVAAANDINYTFAASLYNASTLANGAEPGAILTTPGKLDDDQIRMLREQFDARHKGAGQTKRTALLTGGLDIKTIAMKLADLEVAEITKMSDAKICSTFGVPPGVAGLITEAQYSHGPAMRQFIFNTILPLAGSFAGNIDTGIISRFTSSKLFGENFPAIARAQAKFFTGSRSLPMTRNRFYRESLQKAVRSQGKVFAWFDANQHPVVQEAMQESAEKALKHTTYGVKLNNIIEAYDLQYETVPWGDDWWIAMGQIPARYTLEAGPGGTANPPYPGETPPETEPLPEPEPGKSVNEHRVSSIENQESKADDARRLRIWNNWKISWAGIEREYKEQLRILFVHQQNELIKKLRLAAMLPNKGVESVFKLSPDEIIARVVFDLTIEDNKVRVINQTFFDKASELGIRQVFNEIVGLTGDKLNEQTQAAKNSIWLKGKLLISSQKITGINRTTQKLVASQLKTGLESGETVNDLANRIGHVLGENRGRALNIARTQTAGAVGSGRHTGMKAAGVELKSWLTAGDETVRSAHREAGQKYADGIAVDLPFVVAGETLMFPGDPSGSAGNIINCRCVELAKLAGGKSFDLAYYENVNFAVRS